MGSGRRIGARGLSARSIRALPGGPLAISGCLVLLSSGRGFLFGESSTFEGSGACLGEGRARTRRRSEAAVAAAEAPVTGVDDASGVPVSSRCRERGRSMMAGLGCGRMARRKPDD